MEPFFDPEKHSFDVISRSVAKQKSTYQSALETLIDFIRRQVVAEIRLALENAQSLNFIFVVSFEYHFPTVVVSSTDIHDAMEETLEPVVKELKTLGVGLTMSDLATDQGTVSMKLGIKKAIRVTPIEF